MRFVSILVLAWLATGCVPKGKYVELEDQLSTCRDKLNKQRETRAGGGSSEAWKEDLRPLIDRGVLEVEEVDGRTVIGMKSEVLFGSGSAELSADGRRTVSELAKVLAKRSDSNWQVEGHTDDQAVSGEAFSSNWELGAARALSVLEVMVQGGMNPARLSAATFGEYAPVASNANDASRAQNRRIEVVLLPEVGSRKLRK